MNPIGYVSRLRRLWAMRVPKEWAKPLDVDLFRDQGYALVEGVFSSDEMQGIRERVGQVYEQELQNQDLLSNPLMSEVLLDSRIVGIAEAVLGVAPLITATGLSASAPTQRRCIVTASTGWTIRAPTGPTTFGSSSSASISTIAPTAPAA